MCDPNEVKRLRELIQAQQESIERLQANRDALLQRVEETEDALDVERQARLEDLRNAMDDAIRQEGM